MLFMNLGTKKHLYVYTQEKINKNHDMSKCVCFLTSLNININKVMYTIKWIW